MSRDELEYLGEVAAWLKTAPKGTRPYGEFYVGKVEVFFDADHLGTFTDDDPDWYYTAKETS